MSTSVACPWSDWASYSVGRLTLNSASKERRRIKERQKTQRAKDSRASAKLSKDHRMGKVDAKKAHRSDRVPLEESAKSTLHKQQVKKPRRQAACSNCKLPGHNASKCKLPNWKKRSNADLVEFDYDELNFAAESGIKPNKKRKQLDFVSAEEWI